MSDICNALWPNALLPPSFFELVQRLWGAPAQIELWKRSTCLEGAREALAAVQMWWPRMELEPMKRNRPEGEKRKAEDYYEKTMPAARVSERKCTREKILEDLH